MSKEHGILFKPEMIQAILEGRKTMTRRVVKPQPEVYDIDGKKMYRYSDKKNFIQAELSEISEPFIGLRDLKYAVGDLLYVKEAFQMLDWWEDSKVVQVMYNNAKTLLKTLTNDEWNKFSRWQEQSAHKSPLFMFKSMSRIWLKITDIKVERLQDISEEDAVREGIFQAEYCGEIAYFNSPTSGSWQSAKESFQSLWQSINGKESWNNNPFVWVISFKRIDKN